MQLPTLLSGLFCRPSCPEPWGRGVDIPFTLTQAPGELSRPQRLIDDGVFAQLHAHGPAEETPLVQG